MYKLSVVVAILCIAGINAYVVTKDVPKENVLEELGSITVPNSEADPCQVPEDILEEWPPADGEEDDMLPVYPELEPEFEDGEAPVIGLPYPEVEIPQIPEVLPLPIEPEVEEGEVPVIGLPYPEIEIPEILPEVLPLPIEPEVEGEVPVIGLPYPEIEIPEIIPEVLPLPIEPEVEESEDPVIGLPYPDIIVPEVDEEDIPCSVVHPEYTRPMPIIIN